MPFNRRRRGKYNSRKIEYGGMVFDSQAEFSRYLELSVKGIPIKIHPQYVLLKTFKYKGKTIQGVKYSADFEYRENGIIIIEEVKSKFTKKDRDYILRKKMFLMKIKDKKKILFVEVIR